MSSNHIGIGMTSQRTRMRMVQRLREQGIRDEVVLNAMGEVPRHIFVDEALAHRAYEDIALPIGFGQTISNPWVVARMLELARNGGPLGKVLEIGTGCGYQAAVLSRLAKQVYSVERISQLLMRARLKLRELRITNVRVKHGDGHLGLKEVAPYDAIVMAAAATHVPDALLAQLAPGGRLVLEFHHLLPMVEQAQVDTVRHGHWVYLSMTALTRLLPLHDLVPVRAVPVPVFGGSLRVTVARLNDRPEVDASVAQVLSAERRAGLDELESLVQFGQNGRRTARAFARHLMDAREKHWTVAGYGAPSKAPVLVSLAGVDDDLLPYTVDLSTAKQGCRLPGTRIPILSPDELLARRPNEVVVLTWDIADEIVHQLSRSAEGTGWQPKLFVPLPAPRYVSASEM